jgi:hypothetical protein
LDAISLSPFWLASSISLLNTTTKLFLELCDQSPLGVFSLEISQEITRILVILELQIEDPDSQFLILLSFFDPFSESWAAVQPWVWHHGGWTEFCREVGSSSSSSFCSDPSCLSWFLAACRSWQITCWEARTSIWNWVGSCLYRDWSELHNADLLCF